MHSILSRTTTLRVQSDPDSYSKRKPQLADDDKVMSISSSADIFTALLNSSYSKTHEVASASPLSCGRHIDIDTVESWAHHHWSQHTNQFKIQSNVKGIPLEINSTFANGHLNLIIACSDVVFMEKLKRHRQELERELPDTYIDIYPTSSVPSIHHSGINSQPTDMCSEYDL